MCMANNSCPLFFLIYRRHLQNHLRLPKNTFETINAEHFTVNSGTSQKDEVIALPLEVCFKQSSDINRNHLHAQKIEVI